MTATYTFWYHGPPDSDRTPPLSLISAVEAAMPMLLPGRTHRFVADALGHNMKRSDHTFTNPAWSIVVEP